MSGIRGFVYARDSWSGAFGEFANRPSLRSGVFKPHRGETNGMVRGANTGFGALLLMESDK
jgi:hypothetical protein